MVLEVPLSTHELPGRECWPSFEGTGRSWDAGLIGGSIRVSISVDFDLTKKDFERLEGCGWPSTVDFVLLSVRQTEATFDSDSDLLFSRLNVPNPNFFRKDDALELREPVLTERFLLNELDIDPVFGPSSSVYAVVPKIKIRNGSPKRRKAFDTIKKAIKIVHQSI